MRIHISDEMCWAVAPSLTICSKFSVGGYSHDYMSMGFRPTSPASGKCSRITDPNTALRRSFGKCAVPRGCSGGRRSSDGTSSLASGHELVIAPGRGLTLSGMTSRMTSGCN